MSGVLESSVEDHGFNPQSSETKIYNIGICSFSDEHASLMNKNKYWLVPRSRKNWRYQSGNQKSYIDVEHSDNAKENGITMFYKSLHMQINRDWATGNPQKSAGNQGVPEGQAVIALLVTSVVLLLLQTSDKPWAKTARDCDNDKFCCINTKITMKIGQILN